MTSRCKGLLATAAALVLFGGLHLEIASGRALDRIAPDDARIQTGTAIAESGVNRGAKGDREAMTASAAEGRTITFQHPELPSTTVALRLWETFGLAKGRAPLKDAKEKNGRANKPKHAVACEGVVSALTEVAKQLEAGRCVT